MLEFDCKEDWNAMGPIAGGRFCGKCQHGVIDFSNWDRRAMEAYLRERPDTCGQYRPEQLETDLIPLSELLSFKKAALVAGLTLGTIQVSAQAVDPAPTEQTVPTPGREVRPFVTDAVVAPTHKPDGIEGTCPRPASARVKAKRYRSYHLYITPRFPFFKWRNRRVKGRRIRGRGIF